ncbi:MAG TPA: dihydrolipoyl dehydrogenase [Fibrobacteria bacterium]|nr:dihydrolipoyl dehydrogenase [Fibrobacteria bacterium]
MENTYDILVIGSGPGGYVAAIKGAQAGKRTALVEKADLGGICLNWGCIPTKALLKSAEVFDTIRHADSFGVSVGEPKADFAKVVDRSRDVAKQNSNGVQFLMKKNKIEVVKGQAKILAKGLVEVTGADGAKRSLKAGAIVIATGASPRQFPQYPIDGESFLTYRHALALKEQPKKLLVIGAGAIGVEFAYFYNTLGTEVHVVEMAPQILPVEDEEIAKGLLAAFKKQGIHCHVGATVEVKKGKDGVEAKIVGADKQETAVTVDKVLVAVGMVPNSHDLGLEAAGVKVDARGFIAVNAHQETSLAGVYAIGDVAGKQLLAHKASAEAEVAVAHILSGKGHGLDYGQIPGCTYCQPQVASVGLTEKACKEKGIAVKIGRFPFAASGKARAIGHTEGLVKLIFGAKHGELLGAHILGSEATELLAELGLAMKLESTWEEIAHTVHAHPTLSEGVMEAAMDSQGISPHL